MAFQSRTNAYDTPTCDDCAVANQQAGLVKRVCRKPLLTHITEQHGATRSTSGCTQGFTTPDYDKAIVPMSVQKSIGRLRAAPEVHPAQARAGVRH